MNTANWLPYYVLYLQQRQRAQKAEEEKKKAEEEARRAEEEAQRAQETSQQGQEEALKTEETQQEPETVQVEQHPNDVAQPTTETTTVEYTPSVMASTTAKDLHKKIGEDCAVLYEVGSSDFALCENTKAQLAASNSNIAMIIMCCIAIGVGIAALIVHFVDRSIDEKYKSGGNSFYA